MNIFNRDAIVSASAQLKRRVEPVAVKLNGQDGIIYVREVLGIERESYSDKVYDASKDGGRLKNSAAELFLMYASDADGAPMFVDSDLSSIVKLPAAVIDSVVTAGLKLNGMDEKAQADALKKWSVEQTDA